MRREVLLCIMLAAAPLPAFAQGTASAPLAGKLLITGSSTMAPMVGKLGKRVRAQYPGVAITVETGGSVRDDTWLLLRPLNLLTRRAPAGAAKSVHRVRALARGARSDP